MNYIVRIPQFEGPFDLLLDLVDKQRIPIAEIRIADIAEDYLAAIRRMQDLDIVLASDFIRMAGTLLHLKSRSLIPVHEADRGFVFEEPNDPDLDFIFESEDELKSRLLAYRVYKDAAQRLAGYEAARHACLSRPDEPLTITRFELMARDEFLRIAADILSQMTVEEPEEIRTIFLDEITVEEKMDFILEYLGRGENLVRFSNLLVEQKSRLESVATFLAILELTRLCKIKVKQKTTFADIEIQLDVA